MIYGAYMFAPANNGITTPARYTVAKQQLALFALNPKAINKRLHIWLRDVASAAYFARANGGGLTDCNGASNSFGVSPEFCIG